MILRYASALDPGGASGTPCLFGTTTGITGGPSFGQETENISGAAGAIVNLQVTLYTVSNTMGQVLVNSSQVFAE